MVVENRRTKMKRELHKAIMSMNTYKVPVFEIQHRKYKSIMIKNLLKSLGSPDRYNLEHTEQGLRFVWKDGFMNFTALKENNIGDGNNEERINI